MQDVSVYELLLSLLPTILTCYITFCVFISTSSIPVHISLVCVHGLYCSTLLLFMLRQAKELCSTKMVEGRKETIREEKGEGGGRREKEEEEGEEAGGRNQ